MRGVWRVEELCAKGPIRGEQPVVSGHRPHQTLIDTVCGRRDGLRTPTITSLVFQED